MAAEQQQGRGDGAREAGGQSRAGDRADRRASGDEPKQPLTLLGAEYVYVKLPEDRDDKQVVDRNPDEKGSPDPNCLCRVGKM
jgi:hypothetical protein